MSGLDLWHARKAVVDAAPASDRVYFPVRREPRLTVPPVDAPTLADIVWAYWDDMDNEDES